MYCKVFNNYVSRSDYQCHVPAIFAANADSARTVNMEDIAQNDNKQTEEEK
jgi:hypothetical protein